MKMLFFSSERAEVQVVYQDLIDAGISCEVREAAVAEVLSPHASEAEVWIQNDQDAHRAWMLCVELGVGFAKRPAKLVEAVAESEV